MPAHPMRLSVSISVERGTLKVRHTDALLAPPPSPTMICSILSGSSVGGRSLCGRAGGRRRAHGSGVLSSGGGAARSCCRFSFSSFLACFERSRSARSAR
jgi:hypothetical protein